MALTLDTGVRELPGVGPTRAKALGRLGIVSVGDLLSYFPRSYEDRTKICTIADAPEGESVCIAAMVAQPPRISRIRRGLELVRVKVVDDTATMTVTFFNQTYMKDALRQGERYLFFGRAEGPPRARQMTNPVCEREGQGRFLGRIMPIYRLTAGVSNNLISALVERCAPACAEQVDEVLPTQVRLAHHLAQSEFCYRNIHFPESWEALEMARRRFVFEELFQLTCGMALLRARREEKAGTVFSAQDLDKFWALLPFAPTRAQRRAAEEAAADMASGRPMNRLVQGDVGSGKTVVAALCAWLAFQNGAQSAIMAPTEILARQHFLSLSQLLAPAGMRLGLVTGSQGAAERRRVREALVRGEIDLAVGTHALLSEGVEFRRLSLVIADEQHRFGVEQRAALSAKAGERSPHVLVMSATPIPRTLALIVYGDLDVSVVDELPPGRSPVETYVVGEDKRQRMYGFVRRLVSEGRQVYVVCPAVEEGEEGPEGLSDLKAVTAYAAKLKEEVFPELRVAFVHGKMKAKDKEAVMAAFAAGETDVLVSTTVIEVGVDVPNAALMIVENAERFGLSQLHQLRGRVGRGKHRGYCVLMSAERGEESRKRLRVLSETSDGFRIAEEDLRLRGPGDFFGERQHGLPQLHLADLAGDMQVLKEAQKAAEELLASDPGLRRPEHAALLSRVKSLFSSRGDSFN